jgi:hypothetical protein
MILGDCTRWTNGWANERSKLCSLARRKEALAALARGPRPSMMSMTELEKALYPETFSMLERAWIVKMTATGPKQAIR